MSRPSRPAAIQVGDWQADLSTGQLTRGRIVRQVEPKIMDLLFLLASRPGEVFSREEVLAALWPDVVVGDDSLARSVSRLRKALGDDSRAPTTSISSTGARTMKPRASCTNGSSRLIRTMRPHWRAWPIP